MSEFASGSRPEATENAKKEDGQPLLSKSRSRLQQSLSKTELVSSPSSLEADAKKQTSETKKPAGPNAKQPSLQDGGEQKVVAHGDYVQLNVDDEEGYAERNHNLFINPIDVTKHNLGKKQKDHKKDPLVELLQKGTFVNLENSTLIRQDAAGTTWELRQNHIFKQIIPHSIVSSIDRVKRTITFRDPTGKLYTLKQSKNNPSNDFNILINRLSPNDEILGHDERRVYIRQDNALDNDRTVIDLTIPFDSDDIPSLVNVDSVVTKTVSIAADNKQVEKAHFTPKTKEVSVELSNKELTYVLTPQSRVLFATKNSITFSHCRQVILVPILKETYTQHFAGKKATVFSVDNREVTFNITGTNGVFQVKIPGDFRSTLAPGQGGVFVGYENGSLKVTGKNLDPNPYVCKKSFDGKELQPLNLDDEQYKSIRRKCPEIRNYPCPDAKWENMWAGASVTEVTEEKAGKSSIVITASNKTTLTLDHDPIGNKVARGSVVVGFQNGKLLIRGQRQTTQLTSTTEAKETKDINPKNETISISRPKEDKYVIHLKVNTVNTLQTNAMIKKGKVEHKLSVGDRVVAVSSKNFVVRKHTPRPIVIDAKEFSQLPKDFEPGCKILFVDQLKQIIVVQGANPTSDEKDNATKKVFTLKNCTTLLNTLNEGDQVTEISPDDANTVVRVQGGVKTLEVIRKFENHTEQYISLMNDHVFFQYLHTDDSGLTNGTIYALRKDQLHQYFVDLLIDFTTDKPFFDKSHTILMGDSNDDKDIQLNLAHPDLTAENMSDGSLVAATQLFMYLRQREKFEKEILAILSIEGLFTFGTNLLDLLYGKNASDADKTPLERLQSKPEYKAWEADLDQKTSAIVRGASIKKSAAIGTVASVTQPTLGFLGQNVLSSIAGTVSVASTATGAVSIAAGSYALGSAYRKHQAIVAIENEARSPLIEKLKYLLKEWEQANTKALKLCDPTFSLLPECLRTFPLALDDKRKERTRPVSESVSTVSLSTTPSGTSTTTSTKTSTSLASLASSLSLTSNGNGNSHASETKERKTSETKKSVKTRTYPQTIYDLAKEGKLFGQIRDQKQTFAEKYLSAKDQDEYHILAALTYSPDKCGWGGVNAFCWAVYYGISNNSTLSIKTLWKACESDLQLAKDSKDIDALEKLLAALESALVWASDKIEEVISLENNESKKQAQTFASTEKRSLEPEDAIIISEIRQLLRDMTGEVTAILNKVQNPTRKMGDSEPFKGVGTRPVLVKEIRPGYWEEKQQTCSASCLEMVNLTKLPVSAKYTTRPETRATLPTPSTSEVITSGKIIDRRPRSDAQTITDEQQVDKMVHSASTYGGLQKSPTSSHMADLSALRQSHR